MHGKYPSEKSLHISHNIHHQTGLRDIFHFFSESFCHHIVRATNTCWISGLNTRLLVCIARAHISSWVPSSRHGILELHLCAWTWFSFLWDHSWDTWGVSVCLSDIAFLPISDGVELLILAKCEDCRILAWLMLFLSNQSVQLNEWGAGFVFPTLLQGCHCPQWGWPELILHWLVFPACSLFYLPVW